MSVFKKRTNSYGKSGASPSSDVEGDLKGSTEVEPDVTPNVSIEKDSQGSALDSSRGRGFRLRRSKESQSKFETELPYDRAVHTYLSEMVKNSVKNKSGENGSSIKTENLIKYNQSKHIDANKKHVEIMHKADNVVEGAFVVSELALIGVLAIVVVGSPPPFDAWAAAISGSCVGGLVAKNSVSIGVSGISFLKELVLGRGQGAGLWNIYKSRLDKAGVIGKIAISVTSVILAVLTTGVAVAKLPALAIAGLFAIPTVLIGSTIGLHARKKTAYKDKFNKEHAASSFDMKHMGETERVAFEKRARNVFREAPIKVYGDKLYLFPVNKMKDGKSKRLSARSFQKRDDKYLGSLSKNRRGTVRASREAGTLKKEDHASTERIIREAIKDIRKANTNDSGKLHRVTDKLLSHVEKFYSERPEAGVKELVGRIDADTQNVLSTINFNI